MIHFAAAAATLADCCKCKASLTEAFYLFVIISLYIFPANLHVKMLRSGSPLPIYEYKSQIQVEQWLNYACMLFMCNVSETSVLEYQGDETVCCLLISVLVIFKSSTCINIEVVHYFDVASAHSGEDYWTCLRL